MSCTRINSSTRPPKVKASPRFKRAMNDSSIVPMRPPLIQATFIAESLTMVPIDMR